MLSKKRTGDKGKASPLYILQLTKGMSPDEVTSNSEEIKPIAQSHAWLEASVSQSVLKNFHRHCFIGTFIGLAMPITNTAKLLPYRGKLW